MNLLADRIHIPVHDVGSQIQNTRKLPFSTVAEVIGEVVFNVNPSIGASLQERVDSLPVSTRAFYLKLNVVDQEVAAMLLHDSVRHSARVSIAGIDLPVIR